MQKELEVVERVRMEEGWGHRTTEQEAQVVVERWVELLMAEWVALAVPSPPEAGLSRAPPRQLERSMKGANCGPGIVIPEKSCM